MPSGHVFRPGDIITALNGKTIEITNTDAEGRLVLADALVHARRDGATHVLDLATLTGAVVVAIGDFYAGVFAQRRATRLGRSSPRRRSQRRPRLAAALPRALPPLQRSDVRRPEELVRPPAGRADAGGRVPQKFAGDGPWAHLDIAGTAYLERAAATTTPAWARPATGSGSIAELARRLGVEVDSRPLRRARTSARDRARVRRGADRAGGGGAGPRAPLSLRASSRASRSWA